MSKKGGIGCERSRTGAGRGFYPKIKAAFDQGIYVIPQKGDDDEAQVQRSGASQSA